MFFYYLIDPKILTDAVAGEGSMTPKEKSYFKIYAQAESISSMLYFDMGFFYGADDGRMISWDNFLVHWLVNIALWLSAPFIPIMNAWFWASAITYLILYIVVASINA